ncbi:flagellar motor protein MotB [Pyxidicoccus fallax]|uniref:Flagellar motor protein MotB n=1 Tax=Pyxidicoccus fallax TaxID=394095 RepID=A0A848LX81_9BACT|nr:flagellar motor protein MotB [Pyxidicoccus fallax]NMO22152.1 flagellar motor protein MotB [Pyxidicoccus fallax]NPC83553.1 flagellar motor protein MotB [Pyxidicoccus fallax]
MTESPREHGRQEQQGRSWVPWLVTALVVLLAGGVLFLANRGSQQAQALAEQSRQAAEEAANRARDAEAARKQLEEKLAAAEAERAKLSTEKEQLSTEKEQLSQTVQEQEAELAKLKATYDDLQDKMKAEIANGAIRLSQDAGRIQVDLVDKVLFDSGDASISTRGQEVLTRLGGVLSKVEDKHIQVSGHTDDSPPSQKLQGTFPTNWELSVARAVNVVRFLQEKGGVPARRLVAAGYGEMRPISPNATPQGRARNRRIEVLLMPDLPAQRNAAAVRKALAGSTAGKNAVKPAKGTK